ncbi:Fic family protein [Granulicella sp. dw_53]|uniref:Fic family protein n=1 Tax=Granulicella sp. dw_53 TaxID=2719792 RepID=UPI001BD26368|nr:Fic family protein [Granulicella sp. dw_53]
MGIAKKASTAETLRGWVGGNVNAERLAGAILALEGYRQIDPQHPLGGPDGGKDILCTKGGRSYVGAVYFPVGDKSLAAIKKKFNADLKGAKASKVDGIVFVTNQALSQKQRGTLNALALGQSLLCEPIHRERMRVLLDSSAGYGARLQFLGIEMAPEEQFAYFTENDSRVERALEKHTKEITRLARLIERLGLGQREIFHTMALLATPPADDAPTAVSIPDLLRSDAEADAVTSNMTLGFLLSMHRVSCPDLQADILGHLRTVQVEIRSFHTVVSSNGEAMPPAPSEVPDLLKTLLVRWNERYESLSVADEKSRVRAIAQFHAEFLRIHPFADGNGRVARAVLVQQCIDLLGQADAGLLDAGVIYQRALRMAIEGKPDDLCTLIGQIVHG